MYNYIRPKTISQHVFFLKRANRSWVQFSAHVWFHSSTSVYAIMGRKHVSSASHYTSSIPLSSSRSGWDCCYGHNEPSWAHSWDSSVVLRSSCPYSALSPYSSFSIDSCSIGEWSHLRLRRWWCKHLLLSLNQRRVRQLEAKSITLGAPVFLGRLWPIQPPCPLGLYLLVLFATFPTTPPISARSSRN